MNKVIRGKKKKSEKSNLVKELVENEKKSLGVTTKTTKRAIYWANSYPFSDDDCLVIKVPVKWKRYFSIPPNFKVEEIDRRLRLVSDYRIRPRKVYRSGE